jgi:hypothetical protein
VARTEEGEKESKQEGDTDGGPQGSPDGGYLELSSPEKRFLADTTTQWGTESDSIDQ